MLGHMFSSLIHASWRRRRFILMRALHGRVRRARARLGLPDAGPRSRAQRTFLSEVRSRCDCRAEWFTIRVSNWFEWLAPLRRQTSVIAVEIGSFEGLSACFLLWYVFDQADGELICIDPFAKWPRMPAGADNYESRFDANTALFDKRRVVRKVTSTSHPGLLGLLAEGYEGRVDFIYVDGSHNGLDTVIDGALAWKLLRAGGLMVFDDYWWSPKLPRTQRPEAAIDAFLSIVRDEAKVIHRGRQVALRKRHPGPAIR